MSKVSAKASIYVGDTDIAWLVTETPSEVISKMLDSTSETMIQFTLGNNSDWNGKPLYIKKRCINAISPPRDQGEGDTDESE